MRQLCPNCSRLIELPETAAGTDAVCPDCQKAFRVPGSYTPSVDPAAGPVAPTLPPAPTPAAPTRPVPPPGFVPPAPPTPDPVTAPSGYAQSVGCSLAPNVIAWIPAACLTLALLLSFFAWVGSYPGGHAIYTQSPWGALFGRFSVSSVDSTLLQDEPEIKKNIHSSLMLAFYFLLLFLTVAVAWAERVFSTSLAGPPGAVKGVWQLRFTILAGLAGGLLLIFVVQSWSGFGLELAIQKTVEDKYVEAMAQAKQANKSSETNRVAVQTSQELAKHELDETTAYNLVLVAHLLAVLTLLAAWWLDRRGTKAPPRIVLYW